jgi:hypothetical protein
VKEGESVKEGGPRPDTRGLQVIRCA